MRLIDKALDVAYRKATAYQIRKALEKHGYEVKVKVSSGDNGNTVHIYTDYTSETFNEEMLNVATPIIREAMDIPQDWVARVK